MVGSEILKSYLPEFPKEYQYIFSTIKNAKLDPKRLALSTALEVSNSLAVGAQLTLAAGINHFAKDLPKPVLPIIAAGLLTLAYSTGPRKQKEALEK